MTEKQNTKKPFFILFFMLFAAFPAFSRDSCEWHIRVKYPGDIPAQEAIYIAGTFNNWDPGDPDHRLQRAGDGSWQIRLDLPAGNQEFKFTRGSWNSAETKAKGAIRQNRRIRLYKALHRRQYRIAGWQDPAPAEDIFASICGNIEIIPDFFIPQLQRSRRIWIYLPPGYAESEANYPVLYLQDGQNCFSRASAFSGEWQADETLEALIRKKKIPPLIVVGIDSSPEYRLNEYAPFSFSYKEKEIRAQGPAYAAFLSGTLKPYIDTHYKTLSDREHNGVAGSSMGAVISLYTALSYPDHFSMAGALSPSFRLFPLQMQEILRAAAAFPLKVWMDIGSRESERKGRKAYLQPIARMLREKGTDVRYRLICAGEHNEKSWKRRFGRVLRYLYGGRNVP
ncbi:MAG: alpha/beta hydrolase-fold protein [Candidatus Neomarinimicrobiota bacterium]|nr:alpha/beta hydrolase-fold protein [Candidatus Neomarinimicrobiota bacterium]MDD3965702.1 alpha/beta hydrolase-fold protein [Candidatus Neomarinimicrobiota bacterium]MDX9779940.1 alpha/beta hydrolase-fold protein [bacterium]